MSNYKLLESKDLPSIKSKAYLYQHLKSGAKVSFIKNNDEHRVFNIAFRTPPVSDSGTTHILEHTVLNGSKKYPLKDPFMQMAKSSLKTFINAMTYPDKTLYPIASMNYKDFKNLASVYLDAVFYPLVCHDERIFKQEGWHYELNDLDDNIIYKGVVYNEMKGAFSTPDQLLFRNIQKQLFPDHPYGFISGGIPEDIPKLTYEDFILYYRKYYHPCNSLISFYGDLDIDTELAFLNDQYLRDFEMIDIDSSIPKVKIWDSPRHVELFYPILDSEKLENKDFLSINFLLGDISDADIYKMTILDYVLFDAPGALIKKELLDKKLGEDIYSSFDESIRDTSYSIIAKNTNSKNMDLFIKSINDSLDDLIENKIPRKKLISALNNLEFKVREADFGSFPKGLVYLINISSRWVYDKALFDMFDYDIIFNQLRTEIENSTFTDILKIIRDTNHYATITLKPSISLQDEKNDLTAKELREYKNSLTNEQLEDLIKDTEDLSAYQNSKDSDEDLASLPSLNLTDIKETIKKLAYEEEYKEEAKILYYPTNTSGIVYNKVFFNAIYIKADHIQILNLAANYLNEVSSKNYHYSELSDFINENTGGINSRLASYCHKDDSNHFVYGLEISGKCFHEKIKTMMDIYLELLEEPDFLDIKKLRELINETKSSLATSLSNSGHLISSSRALSYHSKYANFTDLTRGIKYYDFICKWQKASDQQLKELGNSMKKILKQLIDEADLTMIFTYDPDYENQVKKISLDFAKNFKKLTPHTGKTEITLEKDKNEAYIIASDINYVAQTDDYKKYNHKYHGSYKVVNNILSSDYLWNKVRVLGGAYGCMSSISRTGTIVLVSYRDPNIGPTYNAYSEIYQYLRAIDLDQDELTKYIIGTISSLDTPLTPSMETSKIFSNYFSEVLYEDEVKEREEVIATRLEDIRNAANLFKPFLDKKYICTLGSKNAIEANKDLFGKIKNLQ